jgi:hypothetical protein
VLLIGLKSCHRDRKAGFHEAIRATWGKDLPVNTLLRFFMGANPDARDGTPFNKDEIILDCGDDYMSLPHKTRGICQWVQGKMINNVFLCDCDTFVRVPKLLALPYEFSDFAGHFCRGPEETMSRFDYSDHIGQYPQSYPWCSGGIGYFLSYRAVVEVADTFPKVWAEDMYVGQVIGPLAHKHGWFVNHLDINNNATMHFKKSKKFPEFTPELLYRAYKEDGFDGIYEEAIRCS